MTVRTERMTGGITLVFTLCQALFCTLRMRNLTLPLPQTEALYTEEETEDRRSESKSHSVVSNSLRPHGLNSPWNSLGQNTGMGGLSLFQGIFPTQGLNPGRDSQPACVWKPIFARNGLVSPDRDLRMCWEDRNSRGRVEVPDCPLPALQRHSQILTLFSMKEQASGICQTWLAPYWPQLSYCLSIHQGQGPTWWRVRVCFFPNCQGLHPLLLSTSVSHF